jgi:hypothetical protein
MSMIHLLILAIHLLATIAKLCARVWITFSAHSLHRLHAQARPQPCRLLAKARIGEDA